LPAKNGAKLTVTSPAFAAGGDIAFENTQYRGNVFPGLSWTAGPAGTKSYVVIMQDPDAMRNGAPILHWTMMNIPATTTKLDAAMAAPPAGAQYGPNIRGANQPYMGPRTPPGPKHRYHFQIFALDTTIPTATTYAELTAAMKDHVLASGEVIGLGQAAPPAH
jgi:para-nitrobenzyl esterase